jgi:hypothetical protein
VITETRERLSSKRVEFGWPRNSGTQNPLLLRNTSAMRAHIVPPFAGGRAQA